MEDTIKVEPLPYRKRRRTFVFLLLIFVVAIPFLYLYATGYRFDLERPTNLISTGGMYVAVDRTGAEIYIDNELVRETRTFRKAFYAQNLDVGTHRVHVQKPEHHTWVKELPVSKHLVTEAQAFNLPLVPQVRIIAPWKTATGTAVLLDPIGVIASTTNPVMATSSIETTTFVADEEFRTKLKHFVATTATTTTEVKNTRLTSLLTTSPSTTTEALATTTIMSEHVQLFEKDGDVYATWIGSFENMPYYFCAEEFPPYTGTTTPTTTISNTASLIDHTEASEKTEEYTLHPVQTVSEDTECDPTIRIDRKWKDVLGFNFFPSSTDLVIMQHADGLFVVEVDDRSWQNVQPLLLGTNLEMYIENRVIYVYDGTYIYQILFDLE